MLEQANLIRKYPPFLVLAASLLFTSACFTIVTKPPEEEARSDALLEDLNPINPVVVEPDDSSGFPVNAEAIDLVDLIVNVRPANGGRVAVKSIPDWGAGYVRDGVTGVSDIANREVTGPVTVHQYPSGMQVRLEAVPEDGYWFSRWEDGCISVNLNVCVLEVTEDAYAVARFLKLPSKNELGKK